MKTWVQIAQEQPVTDVGQLTKDDKKHLDKLVKRGYLVKGQNVNFPKPRPFWVSAFYLGILPGPLNKG